MEQILNIAPTVLLAVIAGVLLLVALLQIDNRRHTAKGGYKKLLDVLRWVIFALALVLAGWLAVTFRVNIGKWVNKLFKARERMPDTVADSEGNTIGEVVDIVKNLSPVRDRGTIKTSSGEELNLPKGVADKDVKRVVKVGDHDYVVEVEHEKLTDLLANL